MKLDLPIVGTPSRTETGSRCHRRGFLSNRLERGLYSSPSAAFGTVIHAGAATWWSATTRDANALLRAEHSVKDAYVAEFSEPHKTLTLDLGLAIIRGYAEQAQVFGAVRFGSVQLVSVEERLEIPLRGHRLSFQQDRVVYHKDLGTITVIDTKTTGRLDARWERQWFRSLQMKLYKRAAQIAYDRPVDVVVEGVLKDLPTKVRYVPTPEWSERALDEAVDQFERVCDADAQLVERATVQGVVDLSLLEELAVNATAFNYEDCYSYNVECPFLRLCMADPDERVGLLRSEYHEVAGEY